MWDGRVLRSGISVERCIAQESTWREGGKGEKSISDRRAVKEDA